MQLYRLEVEEHESAAVLHQHAVQQWGRVGRGNEEGGRRGRGQGARGTCGRGLQELGRSDSSGLEVLVHQVSKHRDNIGLAPLVPVAVHCQPIAQILRLLTCNCNFKVNTIKLSGGNVSLYAYNIVVMQSIMQLWIWKLPVMLYAHD